MLTEAKVSKPGSFLEIGVFSGIRGVEVIEACSLSGRADDIIYHGFDLFDFMDEDILRCELSKTPDPIDTVRARLESTGAQIHLHKGWTQQTLPDFREMNPDFRTELAFIDGGHAVDTIRSDWEHVSHILSETGTAIFDDFYVDCPHLTDEFGCNTIIEELDRDEWEVEILPEVDRFVNDGTPLNVSFVKVNRVRK